MASSFPCTCYTKKRTTISPLTAASLVSLMSYTPQTTRKVEKHPSVSRKVSSIHTPQEFERRWTVLISYVALLIMDKLRGQMNVLVQENLEDNKILVVSVPAHTYNR